MVLGVLLSDRGTHFVNRVVESLAKVMDVPLLRTASYNPYCNGMCERANGVLIGILKKLCEKRVTEWDKYLDAAVYYHRIHKNRELGIAPFTLVFGQEARLFPGDRHIREEKEIQSFVDRVQNLSSVEMMREFQEEREAAKFIAKSDFKKKSAKFKVGDLVLVVDSAAANSKSAKLLPKNHGPYQIAEVLRNGSFRVTTSGRVLSQAINGRRLLHYHETPIKESLSSGRGSAEEGSCVGTKSRNWV